MKITYNQDMAPRKKGSGRKPLSYSFVTVPLQTLYDKFKDFQQPIVLSKKWCESVSIAGQSKPASKIIQKIEGTLNPEVNNSMKIVDLNESTE